MKTVSIPQKNKPRQIQSKDRTPKNFQTQRKVSNLHIAACAVSGAMLSFAFPRANLFPVAWFAAAPFMYYIYRLPWKQALLSAFVFGAALFAGLLYWVILFGFLPFILLAAVQSLLYIVGYAALAKALGSRLGPWGRMLLLPSLWVLMEWINSLWITGFPWGNIGYSQYRILCLVQLCSVTGAWGISFLVAMSNAVLANIIAALKQTSDTSFIRWQAVIVIVFVGAVWIFGAKSMDGSRPIGKPLRAGVVQGNIDPNEQHDTQYQTKFWRTYSTLTREAADDGARIIVWPEGIAPGYIRRDPVLLHRLTTIAEESGGVTLLMGGRDEGDEGQVYNCAFLIGPPTGLLDRYIKVHLVPFGEFVMLRNYLPIVERYPVLSYDVTAGREFNVLKSNSDRIGTVICFESIFPQISRKLADSGAEILCVITNDAWFEKTAAAEQHMSKSVFRAVENRRYLLHGAATGISCIIDPCGRILESAGLFEEKLLVSDITLISGKSFYTKHGDWFVYFCIAACFLLGLSSCRRAAGGNR